MAEFDSWPFRTIRAMRAFISEALPAPVRAWLYGVALATLGLGVTLGWWPESVLVPATALLVALLMVDGRTGQR